MTFVPGPSENLALAGKHAALRHSSLLASAELIYH
jgi:hypothetical protein